MLAAVMESTSAQPIPAELMRRLQERSDARGLVRFAGHLVLMLSAGALYGYTLHARAYWLAVPACVALGFTYATMFAAMHECVHRTAFRTPWLNEAAGWLAGLLSFYNATFYRYYHTWHHRFTNLPGQDPELGDPKPHSLGSYLLELSGLTWWLGKLKTHFQIAAGRTDHPFLPQGAAAAVVRSVRAQLAVYALLALLTPFVSLWVVPMMLGQPLLRAILLAEHTGCATTDAPLENTRTTHTVWLVRFLMWEMPFHAEHHRYPALPFFSLAEAHETMGPLLQHVARDGYLGMHRAFLKELAPRP
jgi:fatty acid desaturase